MTKGPGSGNDASLHHAAQSFTISHGTLGDCELHYFSNVTCENQYWLGFLSIDTEVDGCNVPFDQDGNVIGNLEAVALRCPDTSPVNLTDTSAGNQTKRFR
jgi:hypothetical protein